MTGSPAREPRPRPSPTASSPSGFIRRALLRLLCSLSGRACVPLDRDGHEEGGGRPFRDFTRETLAIKISIRPAKVFLNTRAFIEKSVHLRSKLVNLVRENWCSSRADAGRTRPPRAAKGNLGSKSKDDRDAAHEARARGASYNVPLCLGRKKVHPRFSPSYLTAAAPQRTGSLLYITSSRLGKESVKCALRWSRKIRAATLKEIAAHGAKKREGVAVESSPQIRA